MNKNKSLSVMFGEKKVGTLATAADHRVAFEYEDEWIRNGFSISPFSLPLQKKVFLPKSYDPFEGLFGVFSDSLPDGWGRLLVDRLLLKKRINPAEVHAIDRLAIVGASGMGALTYQPESSLSLRQSRLSLDELAAECQNIFESKESDNLDVLFQMGGSSGGARPKVFNKIDGQEWIIKFPSSQDKDDIGVQEYKYSLCARKCGIPMTETKLLDSKKYGGFFATKRFDRDGDQKIHMLSVSALLETSHRIPNLDYHILMQLTLQLTNDYRQVEQMFRLMCFNVFSHNRDDHAKNFSFLYCKDEGRWILSPAYDLTFSNSIGGEHATTIDGNGRNPGMKELLAVAENIKLDRNRAKRIAEEIQDIVLETFRQNRS
ncbi:MAG: type II toxin-antitoxin system HipA family toxin [Lachnospiraceae bacterium]